MKSERVKNIFFFRIIARLIPLKHRLNFLIAKYLTSSTILEIPYIDGYRILILPNRENKTTISDLIFEGPTYLPEYKLIKELQSELPAGYCYVDVGSNIGTTLWLFAKRAEKVICFEPIPHLNNTIRQSIETNNARNVLLIEKAAGNEEGEIEMLNNNNSSVIESGTNSHVINAQITKLDTALINERRIDFIKIDVEGFEYKVLEGANRIINKYRPKLLIELHPGFILNYGNNYLDVINFVENLSYTISFYSFLDELTLNNKWSRVSSRWLPKRIRRFRSKDELGTYVLANQSISSYHLFCEPK